MSPERSVSSALYEPLKPSKLKRHLETRHPALAEKRVEYFKRRENRLQIVFATQSKSALKASYLLARQMAQIMMAFTIAEELMLPAAVYVLQDDWRSCCERNS